MGASLVLLGRRLEGKAHVVQQAAHQLSRGPKATVPEPALLPGQHLEDLRRAPAKLAARSTAHLGQDADVGELT